MNQSHLAQFLADAENAVQADRIIAEQRQVIAVAEGVIAGANGVRTDAAQHLERMHDQVAGRSIKVVRGRAVAMAPVGSADFRPTSRVDLSGLEGIVIRAGLASKALWNVQGLYIAFRSGDKSYAFLVAGSQFDIN